MKAKKVMEKKKGAMKAKKALKVMQKKATLKVMKLLFSRGFARRRFDVLSNRIALCEAAGFKEEGAAFRRGFRAGNWP